jgi:hypothetical protein
MNWVIDGVLGLVRHRLRVKAGAPRFDEIVEVMFTQQLIQTSIKRMARSRRQVRGGDPHR